MDMIHDVTVDTLNDLIETSKDGEFGFRTAADCIRNEDTKQILLRRADECRSAAAELAALVVEYGGTAEVSGTTGGAVHRGWVTLKSKLASFPDKTILEETEKGEDTCNGALPPCAREIAARSGSRGDRAPVRRRQAQPPAGADTARPGAGCG
jgi:uncharacterized protein (TIGR02284 family)